MAENSVQEAGAIRQKIQDVVVEELGLEVKTFGWNKLFLSELGADSLDQVELIMRFEEEFGIEIPDEVAEKLDTPEAIFNYAKERGLVAE